MEVPVTEIKNPGDRKVNINFHLSLVGNSTEQLLASDPHSDLSSHLRRSEAWVIIPISTSDHDTLILKTLHGISILLRWIHSPHWLAPYSSSLLHNLSQQVPRTRRSHCAPCSCLFPDLRSHDSSCLDHPSLLCSAESFVKIQSSPPPEAFPSQGRRQSSKIREYPLFTFGAALLGFHCNGLFYVSGSPTGLRIPWVFVSSELAHIWARTFPLHYLIA